MKYYAVKNGRKPGIYTTWQECKRQIISYSNAKYKSFATLEEAQTFAKSGETYLNAKEYNYEDFDAVIHTDGGCRNHGKRKGEHVKKTDPSAWCYRIDLPHEAKSYVDTNGRLGGTNNEMELAGIFEALKDMLGNGNVPNLTSKRLLFVCDSKYALYSSDKKWLSKKANNYFDMPNGKLWEAIYNLLQNYDHISWAWTHGHRGEKGNEFVDHTLNKTMDQLEEKSLHNPVKEFSALDNFLKQL